MRVNKLTSNVSFISRFLSSRFIPSRFVIVLTLLLVIFLILFVFGPKLLYEKEDDINTYTQLKRSAKTPKWISRSLLSSDCSFLNGSEAAIFFHAWPRNAWRFVMDDIVATLQASPLSECGVPTFVGFPSDEIWPYENVDPLLHRMIPPPNSAGHAHNEPVTLAALTAWCSEAPDNRIAIYIHDKGVRKPMKEIVHFIREWDWRKLHEYFLIERPQGCFRALTSGMADACGSELRQKPAVHFSGNFWAAHCNHIVQLPPPLDWVWEKDAFFSPEFWIGQVPGKTGQAARLFNCFTSHVDHYKTEFSRSLYAGETCEGNVPSIP